jgi:hypothetical protein
MPICKTCSAPIEGDQCDYDVPLERAPGIGDPELLASGRMSAGDHELHIARWRVHHPDERGATPAVMEWARAKVAGATQPPPA